MENVEIEYALHLRKIPYNKDTYFYKADGIVSGYRKGKTFYTSEGLELMSIEDPLFNFSEVDDGYDLAVSDSFLREKSKNSVPRSGLEKFDYFYDIMNNYIIMGKYNLNDKKFDISYIKKDNFLDKDSDKTDKTNISDTHTIIRPKDFDKKKEEEKKHEERQKELEEAFSNMEVVSRDSVDSLIALSRSKELYKELKSRIIGQDDAIESIVATIYMNSFAKNPRERTRCFLVGPTGSGKSEIINTIKDVYGLPVIHIDSTTKTAPGYVGDDITDDLADLIVMCGGNIEKAEHGIVAFDELDKKGTLHNGDVNGKDIINELLRFCDGSTYNVTYNLDGRKHTTKFDTSNLIILASGAFPEVFDAKKKEMGKKEIGFGSDIKEDDDTFIKLTPTDLATTGKMGSELMGRFTMIATLKRLSKEELKKILLSSSISPLKIMENNFERNNIRFLYNSDFIDKVAEEAYNLNTGGRALKSIIDNATKSIIMKLITDDDLKSEDGYIYLNGCVVDDKAVVLSSKEYKELFGDNFTLTKDSKISDKKIYEIKRNF